MDLINSKFIFLDENISSQEEAFDFLATKAVELGVATDVNAVVTGFKAREVESTTGFEDGFAIPHTRVKEITKAAVLVVRFNSGVDWKSMDGKPTKVAIALLVPDGKGGEHMSILSDVAVKLMDGTFKENVLKAKNADDVVKAFNAKKEAPKASTNNNVNGLNIIAITACAVGIAHTYMAEDKILSEAAAMGHNIRVETHGSKGIGTPFTKNEIENADLVLFATDVNVDKSRFSGKKFYQVKVAKAIKETKSVISAAIKQGVVLSSDNFTSSNGQSGAKAKEGVLQHLLSGISYMVPVIVLGGICLAFSLGVAKAVWGPWANPDGSGTEMINGQGVIHDAVAPWGPLNILNFIGGAAFTLMIPILAGFIGNSIAGRAAIGPAMVGAFIGNDASKFMPMPGMDAVATPTGFIGAIIAGLLVGYFVKFVNTWKVPKALRAAMPIFFIPLMAGVGISIIFIYVIGGPIGWVMDKVSNGIHSAYSDPNFGIALGLGLGALVGAMAGFDMGGPINKIAFVTCSAMVVQGIYEPMGAMAAAIPVAPLGMGFTTIFFKKFFDKDTRGMGLSAIIMGCIGISEGAIPFAIRDPKRAIVSNVAGSLVAGSIAGALKLQDYAAHGGPIVAVLGAVPYGQQTPLFFIAVAAGVVVTATVYGFWLLADAGKPGSVKAIHVLRLETLANQKRDAIQELKDQIQELKDANYTAKKMGQDNIVESNKTKIDSLKQEIANIKQTYKQDVVKSKVAYKQVAPEEKQKIKTIKVEMKTQKQNVVEVEKQKIASSKEQLSVAKAITVKAERIKAEQEAKLSIERSKENLVAEIDKIQINSRATFAQKYNSLV